MVHHWLHLWNLLFTFIWVVISSWKQLIFFRWDFFNFKMTYFRVFSAEKIVTFELFLSSLWELFMEPRAYFSSILSNNLQEKKLRNFHTMKILYRYQITCRSFTFKDLFFYLKFTFFHCHFVSSMFTCTYEIRLRKFTEIIFRIYFT